VTAEGATASALSGSAKSVAANVPADAPSISRRDQFRFRIKFSLRQAAVFVYCGDHTRPRGQI
jgi:hypothetical protein